MEAKNQLLQINTFSANLLPNSWETKRFRKTYSFLVIHCIVTSDKSLRFRKNLAERILKLIKTIDDTIRNEKLPFDINKEVAKISALSSCEIDKNE